MIKAIEKNKTIKDGRNIFKQSEDYFTSSVFERLFYLPQEEMWRIIRNSCYGKGLPEQIGKVLSIDYWPHWSANNEDISNTNFVEPDVFIRLTGFDLIIEAKRYDDNQQSHQQWKNEILSYFEEYNEDGKTLYLIALGGLNNEKSENLIFDIKGKPKKIIIIKSRWKRILNEILDYQKSIEYSETGISNIISDIIIVFQLFGFSTGKWFETIPSAYSLNVKQLHGFKYKFSSKIFSFIKTGYNINNNSLEKILLWKK